MNKKLPLIAFATLLLAGCTQPATSPQPTTAPATTSGSMMQTDKTYESTGNYVSSAGPEEISVKLTIDQDGTVTDVVVTPKATAPMSIKWQTAFAGGIKTEVVGKKLADLNVGKVAGSSLTGKAFNEAVTKIKAQM